VILCQHLSKRFGASLAVDDVSFELPAGTLCAFMGANGAGKSTTLSMLTGQLRPSGGRTEVAGVDPARDPALLQRRIGVVPDRLALFDHLSLEEHLLLVGQVHGLKAAEARDRAGRLLDLLGLDSRRHCAADDASHGMRKKTALGMALMHGPRVLVLDEPFEGLDPGASAVLQRTLKAFAAGGGTVLFSCHILAVVSDLADRCLLIAGGRLAGDLTREALEAMEHEAHFEAAPSLEELPWLRSSRS
jgi:ABC-2 type transport system ATP-binding protein